MWWPGNSNSSQQERVRGFTRPAADTKQARKGGEKIPSGGRHLQSAYGLPPVKAAEDVPLKMTLILIVAGLSL